MSSKKLTDLIELLAGNLSGDDYIYVVDVSDATDNSDGSSKKIKVKDILNGSGITVVGTIVSGEWDGNIIESGYIGQHAINHGHDNNDEIAIDSIGETSDSTNLDASLLSHGLFKKLDGSTTKYLTGHGNWHRPVNKIPDNTIRCLVKNTSLFSVQLDSTSDYVAIQFEDGSIDIFNAPSGSSYIYYTTDVNYDDYYGGDSIQELFFWAATGSGDPTPVGTIAEFYPISHDTVIAVDASSVSGWLDIGYQDDIQSIVPPDNITRRFDVTSSPLIESVDLRNSNLIDCDISISNNDSLKSILLPNSGDIGYLYAYSNPVLSYVKLPESSPNLYQISFYGCNLQKMEIPDFSTITTSARIQLQDNVLTDVSIPPGVQFEIIDLSNNELESFDANGAIGMVDKSGDGYVNVSNNNMSTIALNNFFTSLGTVGEGTPIVYASGNPGSSTCDTSIATTKGYAVITEDA